MVSDGKEFTMVFRLSGGRDAIGKAQSIISNNRNCNYPIRSVSDDVPNVAFRFGPKGWIGTTVMVQWLSERRVNLEFPNEERRELFVDKSSGFSQTAAIVEMAERINTDLYYFPPNTKHFVQPCQSFAVQKLKRAWTTNWEN